jgi:hypothetical protein
MVGENGEGKEMDIGEPGKDLRKKVFPDVVCKPKRDKHDNEVC